MTRCASTNLVEVKDFADLDAQFSCSDLLGQFVERRAHEILRFAVIAGQVDCARNRLHWSEIIEGPFVADDAGHADDATLPGAEERIFQSRGAYQFQDLVDTAGADLPDLFGDRAGVDEDLVCAALQQQLIAFRVASRRRNEGTVTPSRWQPPQGRQRSCLRG